ncbi:MAG: magnesium and cobalt exporter, family [Subtercola sp.]|nr:magnesium and cobalt exporter, family [Subtercola sp.]
MAQSTREGVLDDNSGALHAAFEFTEKTVASVALPVARLITLDRTATPADIERAVSKYGFSRYVMVDATGNPIGYLHLKDVIDLDDDEFEQPVPAKRIRLLASIWDGTELEDALATMRRTGAHVARAFSASGDTTGVLFLEDVIEELVGEVQDATRRICPPPPRPTHPAPPTPPIDWGV